MKNPLSRVNQQNKISELEAQLERLKSQVEGEKNKFKKEEDKPLPQLRSIYKWESPARPFVKRDKEYFVKIAFVVMLFILLGAFLQDIALIVVLCSLMFAIYVFGTVKPENIEHEITTRGVKTIGKNYPWTDLDRFWISVKDGYTLLNIDTKLRFPSRLIIIINEGDLEKVLSIMFDYLNYHDVDEQSWLSKKSEGTFLRLDNDESGYSLSEVLSKSDLKKGTKPIKFKVKLKNAK